MTKKNNKNRKGVTLIELLVTVIAATALLIGLVSVLASGHKNYKTMMGRTTSEVVRNGYEARVIFDQYVRKSTYRRANIINSNNELYVYYYSNPQDKNIVNPDMYACFYLNNSGGKVSLMLNKGSYDWENPPTLPMTHNPASDRVVANNVVAPAAGIFSFGGGDNNSNAIQMKMVLDNETGSTKPLETLKLTVTSSAIRHNK